MTYRLRRILHVISGLDVGGAETALREIVTASTPLAEESIVVSLVPGGFHAPALRAAGVKVVDLDFTRLHAPASLVALARLTRAFEPTLVQGWMYYGDLAAAIALKLSGRRAQTKLAWGIRCSNLDFNKYDATLRIGARLCAALSSAPDLIIANSRAGMDVHIAMGYRPARAVVVHNGIDAQKFRPDHAARDALRAELQIDSRAVVVAHVARVDAMKDHETMLAAIARLTNVLTLFVGARTESLPDRPNVRRLGRRNDMPRVLAGADLVVSSSAFGEGFSNSVAEGMACGLPAISTDVGDARTIVGDTGLIVPPSDCGALAAAITGLVQEGAKCMAYRGARARARIIENFSIEQAVRHLGEAYGSLTAS
jgi:glycosyltransferase involved in cell wall biosynthesis